MFTNLGEPWEIRKFQRTVQSPQPTLSSTECLMGDICNSIKETNRRPKDSISTQHQRQQQVNKKPPDTHKNVNSVKQQHDDKAIKSSSISPKTTPTSSRYAINN